METVLRTTACALLAWMLAACSPERIEPGEHVPAVQGAVYLAPEPAATIDEIRRVLGDELDASLPAADVEQLFELVGRFDEFEDDWSISSIRVDDEGRIEIWTGVVWGPLAGVGIIFYFERVEDDAWKLVEKSEWIS